MNKKQNATLMIFLSLALWTGFSLSTYVMAQSTGAACTAGQEGKSACNINGCFKCESLLWKPQALIHGATAAACTSATSGMIQWTGTVLQFCNGTEWAALSTATSSGPTAFAFTNQEANTPNTTISSNEVTLLGYTGTATATCGTGCTSISKNGTWIGATATGFYAGDKIAIRQTSSTAAHTTTTASVTVGSTDSSSWRVTTAYANSFGFTNQTGVNLNTTISSNAVALSGNFANWTAVCGTNCTAIAKDGVWGSTSVAGFNPGNTIAIRMVSSASTSTAKNATVSVGPSSSNTWTVTTTNDACVGSPASGTVCNDGTVYAGLSPDGSVKCTQPPAMLA